MLQTLALIQRRADDPAELGQAAAGRVLFHDVTQLEISATLVRGLLRRGQSAAYLLPEGVLELIRDLAWNKNLGVILSTHLLADVEAFNLDAVNSALEAFPGLLGRQD